MKKCNSCRTEKPLTEFAKAATCRDGHRSYCKACHKLRKDAWRHANKDHHNAKCRAWAKQNPEARKETLKRSNSKRKIEGKERALRAARRAADPYTARADVSMRRSKYRKVQPIWANQAAILNLYKIACRIGWTVDHEIPIKHRDVCGLHVENNLRVVRAKDNSMKSNSFNGVSTRAPRKKDGSMK